MLAHYKHSKMLVICQILSILIHVLSFHCLYFDPCFHQLALNYNQQEYLPLTFPPLSLPMLDCL